MNDSALTWSHGCRIILCLCHIVHTILSNFRHPVNIQVYKWGNSDFIRLGSEILVPFKGKGAICRFWLIKNLTYCNFNVICKTSTSLYMNIFSLFFPEQVNKYGRVTTDQVCHQFVKLQFNRYRVLCCQCTVTLTRPILRLCNCTELSKDWSVDHLHVSGCVLMMMIISLKRVWEWVYIRHLLHTAESFAYTRACVCVCVCFFNWAYQEVVGSSSEQLSSEWTDTS